MTVLVREGVGGGVIVRVTVSVTLALRDCRNVGDGVGSDGVGEGVGGGVIVTVGVSGSSNEIERDPVSDEP